jgi:hypothetical protein
MLLWWEWYRCASELRRSCQRRRTFLWLLVVLIGLTIRTDLAGLSSVVRALGLQGRCYERLLALCHSRAVPVEALSGAWVRLVWRRFEPLRLGGRVVIIGDELKVAKEGRKMPAVKKLHQSSDNNSKAPYIFGHSFQALGLLVQGAAGQVCCVPLLSRIHQGVVFSNRDQRSLLDKFAALFGQLSSLAGQASMLLIADAYYASRKVIEPLLAAGHHLISRVRRNAVAYYPAVPASTPRRGRRAVYGQKVRLRDLWHSQRPHFQSAPSPVYGETGMVLSFFVIDLLWRPIGRLVRFVLVEHPTRGRCILMSTDLTLSALDIITGYGYRFKIEVSFKQALHTLGTYSYHFWMKLMTPITRQGGNQYLHRTTEDYRRLVRRKLDAYHRFVQLGCIAQGLLQYLALYFGAEVWRQFGSWLRTMNPKQAPSEAVVAQALRTTFSVFLADAPQDLELKKFILDHTDFDRSAPLALAA